MGLFSTENKTQKDKKKGQKNPQIAAMLEINGILGANIPNAKSSGVQLWNTLQLN